MRSSVRARLICAALLFAHASPAYAEPLMIDLPSAVARARERAPEAIAALARIGEARAQRVGAGVLITQNTNVQFGAGPRFGEQRTLAIRGLLTQPLEPKRRGARIRAADAELEHAKALSEADLRTLSFEVADAFYEARYAELEVELERHNLDVVTRAVESAERRRKAGEITDLALNVAKVALGRARSMLAAAQSQRATQIGELGALIGARPDDTITLVGDLRPPTLTLDALRAAVPGRADVRALEAETRAAQAELGLAKANSGPDVGLLLFYELDDRASNLLGGLTLTLPFFNRGQGAKAAARAKQRNAELERAALVGAAAREVADAFEAYTYANEGVAVFDRDVLPILADSEQLLTRGVDAGQIEVSEFVIAHLEIVIARREYLQRQLQLAKAAAAARRTAGLNP